MNLFFKKAEIKDIDILVNMRSKVLLEANELCGDVDMSFVERESYEYFLDFMAKGENITYFAYLNEDVVGCGSVCFYRTMPTYNNQRGTNAYIMNMYTEKSGEVGALPAKY